jgi:hypothetical protein
MRKTNRTGPNLLIYYVIYDHPKDLPEYFVVREWTGETPGKVFAITRQLEPIQQFLLRRGLIRFVRHPDDDPVIVETWL